MVAGAVPSDVAVILKRIARIEERTLSQIVRRCIEESPKIKAALKRA
jgi:hypothetical protein